MDLDLRDPAVKDVVSDIIADTLGTALSRVGGTVENASIIFTPPTASQAVESVDQGGLSRQTQAPVRNRRKRSSGSRARTLAVPEERMALVDRMSDFAGPKREAYNKLVRSQASVGDRSVVVVYMAREEFGEDGLLTSEVADVLSRGFRIPTANNAVSMALNRMVSRSNSPIAARGAPWDRNRTLYWLTQDGLDTVANALGSS